MRYVRRHTGILVTVHSQSRQDTQTNLSVHCRNVFDRQLVTEQPQHFSLTLIS